MIKWVRDDYDHGLFRTEEYDRFVRTYRERRVALLKKWIKENF